MNITKNTTFLLIMATIIIPNTHGMIIPLSAAARHTEAKAILHEVKISDFSVRSESERTGIVFPHLLPHDPLHFKYVYRGDVDPKNAYINPRTNEFIGLYHLFPGPNPRLAYTEFLTKEQEKLETADIHIRTAITLGCPQKQESQLLITMEEINQETTLIQETKNHLENTIDIEKYNQRMFTFKILLTQQQQARAEAALTIASYFQQTPRYQPQQSQSQHNQIQANLENWNKENLNSWEKIERHEVPKQSDLQKYHEVIRKIQTRLDREKALKEEQEQLDQAQLASLKEQEKQEDSDDEEGLDAALALSLEPSPQE